MGDVVTAKVCGTRNGLEYSSAEAGYSVLRYCNTMLNAGGTKEFKALLVDLLNYGAAMQVYANYKTDALVNADLSEDQKSWGTAENRDLVSVQNLAYETVENPKVAWKGAGLNLYENVAVRYKIQPLEGVKAEDLTVVVRTQSGAETVFTYEDFTYEGDGKYSFIFDSLHAGQMSEELYATVYQGDTAVSNTVCYSVESYAYTMLKSDNENLVNVIRTLIKYGDAAKAYIAKK